MNEQWTRWEPIQNLAVNYTLEHVHNGMRGLDILLIMNVILLMKIVLFGKNKVSSVAS